MIAANQPRAVAPDYWPVDAALLALMRSCKFDIFLRLTNGTFVLYRQHDTPLDPENLKRLRDSGVTVSSFVSRNVRLMKKLCEPKSCPTHGCLRSNGNAW